MKKLLALFCVLITVFTLSACKKDDDGIDYLEKIDFLPKEFTFSDDSGIWKSSFTLEADGKFSGSFEEINPDEATSAYPGGTVRYCKYSGRFTKMYRYNDFAYSLCLEKLETEKKSGIEEIIDGVRYISDGAYGLTEGLCYFLYLPETPSSYFPENFLFYWPYLPENSETMNCYVIKSDKTDSGFFCLDK